MRLMTVGAALLAAALLPAHATDFRAPQWAAPRIVALEAPLEKRVGAAVDASGRLRVGDVRALDKAAAVPSWARVEGGWITRFSASSAGARGIRVRLDLAELPGPIEVRVAGTAEATIEPQPVDPRSGPQAWTAWTEGDTQTVEVFSATQPWGGAVRIGAVVHFTAAPFEKAAGTCTVPVVCSTGDASIDSAILVAKKSMMRVVFNEDTASFVCTATLIDTPRKPSPYVMTANHCISEQASASSITTLWFYENVGCDASSAKTTGTQVSGGMQLVFGNHNVDATLLLMNGSPPAGAVYAPVNRAELTPGQAMVSLSHPSGDSARLAIGSVTQEYRLTERPQDFFGVKFSRGIIEGGSSGSGLFTLANGALQFRGTLLGTTVNSPGGMSCTDTDEEALYSRFDIFAPEIDGYIGTSSVAADDAPNRPLDLAGQSAGAPLDSVGSSVRNGLRIDYAGDLDTFKFSLAGPAIVSAWSEGPNGANLDTVGALLDENGSWLASNDDASTASNHFGMTTALDPGVYYVQVGHYEPGGTGAYNLKLRADAASATNYTDLWYKSTESGWGLNINHQGNTLFASLFTYDSNGVPVWLAMSDGTRQADGSYFGTLGRYTGAAFNAPWHAAAPVAVGSMRITFNSATTATLQYTFDGVTVTKDITRYVFAKAVSCKWSAFDRTTADNYQDLWYNPGEPGWGINLAHQDKTMFASLFTYDANGNPLWLVMSAGTETNPGKFTGDLARTSGPAFYATPWIAAVSTAVGTMSLAFTDGSHGTLTYSFNGVTVTKAIQRFEFGAVKPDCSSD